MTLKLASKSLHQICTKDERILSCPSAPVTLEEGKELLAYLHSVFNQEEGVGLAAVQLGILKRVCIISISEKQMPQAFALDLINPRIIEKSNEIINHKESCFSVLGNSEYFVKRHVEIVVEDDLNGKVRLSGFPAYVAQHEIQHTEGYTIKMIGTPVLPQPIVRNSKKIGRNDPCLCGSGYKYKKCCLE